MDKPAFILNPPFSLSTEVANNIWMEELPPDLRQCDTDRAVTQFLALYRHLAAESLVFLLPTPYPDGLQDLVYTANLGIVLEHLPDRNTVVVSNFASPPRRGETEVGVRFFESMGYRTVVPDTKFEGEAELKHLHDNVYVGGYGQRSQCETYDWLESAYDMVVVKLAETDPYLYHLDCTVFPITAEQTLVCTSKFEHDELRMLEKHTEVIDVSLDSAYNGLCNSVRLNNVILNSSHIHDLRSGSDEYQDELRKNRELEDIATKLGFEVVLVNLSEYHKSGAMLSCMVMHLNRNSYQFSLL
ncbi:N-dimethylarginine dimethylaminohydrolase [Saccharothrix tamanrassetensis]|uniref:N-dimethylarginine dimethylaminohydrolase n=1 Tax=Saccharothrix tamanrassetensis TaxID=1051531 RepID=A0A841CX76_9PSEU|nr:arginine deiminase-related protein [Saccharothrix tamanrassetensis]MBB5960597.1 N-dimethylarginine dimethylaminohydrolase [Saccharothrix tamanrassetensis]